MHDLEAVSYHARRTVVWEVFVFVRSRRDRRDCQPTHGLDALKIARWCERAAALLAGAASITLIRHEGDIPLLVVTAHAEGAAAVASAATVVVF